MWIIFKVFIEFVTVLLLFFFFSFKFCLFVCFLVEEHVGSSFPDQGSNLYPLQEGEVSHWTSRVVPQLMFCNFPFSTLSTYNIIG